MERIRKFFYQMGSHIRHNRGSCKRKHNSIRSARLCGISADNNPDSDVAHVSLLGTYNKGHLNPIVPRGQVNTVIFDEYNRAWIGTQSDGIIGLSADRKNIIAHYTTKEFPLPHDRVMHLGWNPEDKTLWISTHDGIARRTARCPFGSGEPMKRNLWRSLSSRQRLLRCRDHLQHSSSHLPSRYLTRRRKRGQHTRLLHRQNHLLGP